MGDVAIGDNPAIPIVIRAGRGKMSKIIKKDPIRHNKIPTVNRAMKNFFSALNIQTYLKKLEVYKGGERGSLWRNENYWFFLEE